MEGNSGENSSNSNVRFVGGEEVAEDKENLKRRISGHPLYGLLIETHLNCLEVGFGEIGEVGIANAPDQADSKLNVTIPSPSELDHFMEAYCEALSKLKEAMEEPFQETASFINDMYIQLSELNGT